MSVISEISNMAIKWNYWLVSCFFTTQDNFTTHAKWNQFSKSNRKYTHSSSMWLSRDDRIRWCPVTHRVPLIGNWFAWYSVTPSTWAVRINSANSISNNHCNRYQQAIVNMTSSNGSIPQGKITDSHIHISVGNIEHWADLIGWADQFWLLSGFVLR